MGLSIHILPAQRGPKPRVRKTLEVSARVCDELLRARRGWSGWSAQGFLGRRIFLVSRRVFLVFISSRSSAISSVGTMRTLTPSTHWPRRASLTAPEPGPKRRCQSVVALDHSSFQMWDRTEDQHTVSRSHQLHHQQLVIVRLANISEGGNPPHDSEHKPVAIDLKALFLNDSKPVLCESHN
jgi:hypothetical protein